MASRGVGRPSVTDIPLLTSVLSKFGDRLFDGEGNVLSRVAPVWIELAEAFREAITLNNSRSQPKLPLALYTYVQCNKNGILVKLKPHSFTKDRTSKPNRVVLNGNQSNDSVVDSSLDLSDVSNSVRDSEDSFSFITSVQGCDFDKLIETRVIKDNHRRAGTRKRLKLKKGKSNISIMV